MDKFKKTYGKKGIDKLRQIPYSEYIMRKRMKHLNGFIILGNASVSRGFVEQNEFFKFFKTGYYMTYFFFNKKSAYRESKKFTLKNNPELNRAVWNLLDTKGVKHALKGLLTGIYGIKFRKRLYVKKTKPQITLNYIKNLIAKINEGNMMYNFSSHYLDESFHLPVGDLLKTKVLANEANGIYY